MKTACKVWESIEKFKKFQILEKKFLVNRKKNNFVKEGSKFRDKSSK